MYDHHIFMSVLISYNHKYWDKRNEDYIEVLMYRRLKTTIRYKIQIKLYYYY